MAQKNILAFSSSRSGNSAYLETAVPLIKNFLGNTPLNIAFVPFASVDENYETYASLVREGLSGLTHAINIVESGNARSVIEESDVIMIGGGNTFKLLNNLYQYRLIDLIVDKVNSGTRYIGWSAGSNITGLTIGTTNDMPIIQPESFDALALFPFQINPHYLNVQVEGHNGETRDQRLAEFMKLNPGIPVICLPEGTALQLQAGTLTFIGQGSGVLFHAEENSKIPLRKEITPGDDLSFLL